MPIANFLSHPNLSLNICLNKSNFKYEDVHIEGAKRLAKISRESGVERFIHFSALNASPNPQRIVSSSGSKFLKTKVKSYYNESNHLNDFPLFLLHWFY